MCLQDLRISRRLSRRVVTIDPPPSPVFIPVDLTRAAMVDIQDEGLATRIVRREDAGGGQGLLIDTRFVTNPAAGIVYTRESAGADFSAPAWIYASSGEFATVTIHEYDSETMHEIYGPLKG